MSLMTVYLHVQLFVFSFLIAVIVYDYHQSLDICNNENVRI